MRVLFHFVLVFFALGASAFANEVFVGKSGMGWGYEGDREEHRYGIALRVSARGLYEGNKNCANRSSDLLLFYSIESDIAVSRDGDDGYVPFGKIRAVPIGGKFVRCDEHTNMLEDLDTFSDIHLGATEITSNNGTDELVALRIAVIGLDLKTGYEKIDGAFARGFIDALGAHIKKYYDGLDRDSWIGLNLFTVGGEIGLKGLFMRTLELSVSAGAETQLSAGGYGMEVDADAFVQTQAKYKDMTFTLKSSKYYSADDERDSVSDTRTMGFFEFDF